MRRPLRQGDASDFKLQLLVCASEREIDAAFATAIQQRLGAIFVEPTALAMQQREQLATYHMLRNTGAYPAREFICRRLGSYGANFTDGYRGSTLCGPHPKGDKPAELPVLQPTKFDLVS